MTSTQVLLGKIAALRQRLSESERLYGVHRTESAAGLSNPSHPDRGPSRQDGAESNEPTQNLEARVLLGAWQNSMLEASVIDNAPGPYQASALSAAVQLPRPAIRLTARTAQLLKRGRSLLQELRRLADEPVLADQPLDALTRLHRDTAAILDSVLRAIQNPPETASGQARICDGLEATLNIVMERIGIIDVAIEHRRRLSIKIDGLVALMQTLARGQSLSLHAFEPLAMQLLDEARQGQPLQFFRNALETTTTPTTGDLPDVQKSVACHSLIVAQVAARLVVSDPEWSGRQHEPVLAALLHDIGMLSLPADLLAQSGPLSDEQRRIVEGHTTAGAEMLRRLVPVKNSLVQAAAEHHERLDGTGYPAGLRADDLSPLVRLLAVCDTYAALASPRPYRAVLDTRTALTDTLLLAEQGALDRVQAERLLDLSFYPVGSIVELADGAVGVVVATHSARNDLRAPARPILSMLVDCDGRFVPFPSTLDLLHQDRASILRALPCDERQNVLGSRYLELAFV